MRLQERRVGQGPNNTRKPAASRLANPHAAVRVALHRTPRRPPHVSRIAGSATRGPEPRGEASEARPRFDPGTPASANGRKKVVIPSAELTAILRNCRDQKALALWGLLVYTGMGRDEIRRLTWEDISDDWTASIIGKGGKERAVPIHPDLPRAVRRARRSAGRQGRPTGTIRRRGVSCQGRSLLEQGVNVARQNGADARHRSGLGAGDR